jgi:hypothetical protein
LSTKDFAPAVVRSSRVAMATGYPTWVRVTRCGLRTYRRLDRRVCHRSDCYVMYDRATVEISTKVRLTRRPEPPTWPSSHTTAALFSAPITLDAHKWRSDSSRALRPNIRSAGPTKWVEAADVVVKMGCSEHALIWT